MKKHFVVATRVLGMVLVAHALMLIGADEITTIESGGVRTIRSLEHILTLYGADPKAWGLGLPAPFAKTVTAILALPGWGSWPPSAASSELSPVPENDASCAGLRSRLCPL